MGAIGFDAPTHTYTLDGDRLRRSTTGVLKGAGLYDFAHIPPAQLAAALRRGTTVHQAIHFFNDHDFDLDAFRVDFPDYVGYVDAWIRFCQTRSFLPVLNEHRIASRLYRIGGTIDCLGILDGGGVLLDFATGNPADVAKDLQTAAYLMFAREWAADDPPLADFLNAYPSIRRFGVALHADGSFRLEHYGDPSDLRHVRT